MQGTHYLVHKGKALKGGEINELLPCTWNSQIIKGNLVQLVQYFLSPPSSPILERS